MTNKNELNANERTENMEETNSRKKQRGFTLAETLIALVVLGIVAAITVPQLVRKHVERANRTKFKKVMTVYDFVMNKIVTENDLKSNTAIQSWATKDNTVSDCSVAYNYFKSVKDLSTDSKCKFKTADGVYWDITDIQKPIVALKENDLTDLVAQSDTNRAFYLYAQYDGTGILRITESNFDYTLTSDKQQVNDSVDRLWAYLKGETSTSQATVVDTRSDFAKNCAIDPDNPNSCTLTYNCPTTANPIRTCTQVYTKVGMTAEKVTGYDFCDYEYNSETGEKTCTSKAKSESEADEDIWMADMGTYSNWAYTDRKAYCNESQYTSCSSRGDYWTLARKNCEAQGMKLANVAELRSLKKAGKLASFSSYWTAEAYSNNTYSAYYFYTDGSSIYTGSVFVGNKAVCVGK